MLVSTAGMISDFLTELTRLLTTAEGVMDTEGEEEEEVAVEGADFLIERALTNLSPKDSRSCIEGGSSLKNKLLCGEPNKQKSAQSFKILSKTLKFACCISHKRNYCTFNKQLLFKRLFLPETF